MIDARAVRAALTDVRKLISYLRLDASHRPIPQAGGLIIRCPWHEERSPSCSVRLGRDGTVAVRCHGCGASGDALSLVAVVEGLDVRRDFVAVLERAAELAGVTSSLPAAPVRRPSPMPIVDRDYPPIAEVRALLAASGPVSLDAEASAMLAERGLDAELVDAHDLAVVVPACVTVPRWASFRGAPWTRTGHRLLVPMFDATGALRTVRAWRVVESDLPKRLPPGGYRASGVVMADEFALAMLRGTYAPRRVVVVEGEPDFFAHRLLAGKMLAARLGIVSGSWSDELSARIPDGAEVTTWTDDDDAGERYAVEVRASLERRCVVLDRPRAKRAVV